MKSFLITGTDTEVGKTYVTTGMIAGFWQLGVRASVMKPIATGATWKEGAKQSQDVDLLFSALTHSAKTHERAFHMKQNNDDTSESFSSKSFLATAERLINTYLFIPPIAPLFAARRSGCAITSQPIFEAFYALDRISDLVIIEGIGGWRTPIGEAFGLATLATQLELGVILVVGLRLGCVNHALITMTALLQEGVHVSGWVANMVDQDYDRPEETVEYLSTQFDTPCLGFLPHVPAASQEQIATLLALEPFSR